MISLELVDTVFKDDLAALVDKAINDAGEGEYAANDSAHADEELKEVLSDVGVLDSEG